jgi:hypothetical protein
VVAVTHLDDLVREFGEEARDDDGSPDGFDRHPGDDSLSDVHNVERGDRVDPDATQRVRPVDE